MNVLFLISPINYRIYFCKFDENYFLQKNCKKLSAMAKNKDVLFFRVAQSPSLK